MTDLLKIIVTDSSGTEHIFNESKGDVENYLDLRPIDYSDNPIPNAIKITTRTFESGSDKFDSESVAIFFNPLRVDCICGKYE